MESWSLKQWSILLFSICYKLSKGWPVFFSCLGIMIIVDCQRPENALGNFSESEIKFLSRLPWISPCLLVILELSVILGLPVMPLLGLTQNTSHWDLRGCFPWLGSTIAGHVLGKTRSVSIHQFDLYEREGATKQLETKVRWSILIQYCF